MGFGMGGGGNLGKMMQKQMIDMQKKMEDMQRQLEEERVVSSVGGGMVTATANGLGKMIEIKINPEVINPEDAEMLEDLVTAAVTEALETSEKLREEKMAGLIPGGMGGLKGLM